MNEESTFELANKSEALFFSVFDITTSRSHFPVKYQRLSCRLQDCALDIHGFIMDANGLKTEAQKAERFKLQTKVISKCNHLASLAKYSLHAQLISCATSELWIGLVHDIKYMTLAWRKSG